MLPNPLEDTQENEVLHGHISLAYKRGSDQNSTPFTDFHQVLEYSIPKLFTFNSLKPCIGLVVRRKAGVDNCIMHPFPLGSWPAVQWCVIEFNPFPSSALEMARSVGHFVGCARLLECGTDHSDCGPALQLKLFQVHQFHYLAPPHGLVLFHVCRCKLSGLLLGIPVGPLGEPGLDRCYDGRFPQSVPFDSFPPSSPSKNPFLFSKMVPVF